MKNQSSLVEYIRYVRGGGFYYNLGCLWIYNFPVICWFIPFLDFLVLELGWKSIICIVNMCLFRRGLKFTSGETVDFKNGNSRVI
jgi:hypothetical protein